MSAGSGNVRGSGDVLVGAVDAKAMRGVKAIFDRYELIAKHTSFTGFDRTVMTGLTLVAATHTPTSHPLATCTFTLHIDQSYTNLNGVMHGGAAGVIFDMATTSALGPLAKPGFWDFMGGVTRALNLAYLRAVPVGITVRIYSEVIQVGRTMAMIRGTMTSLDGKVVYCTAEHQKVAVPSRASHLQKEFEIAWDKEMGEDARLAKEKTGAKL